MENSPSQTFCSCCAQMVRHEIRRKLFHCTNILETFPCGDEQLKYLSSGWALKAQFCNFHHVHHWLPFPTWLSSMTRDSTKQLCFSCQRIPTMILISGAEVCRKPPALNNSYYRESFFGVQRQLENTNWSNNLLN